MRGRVTACTGSCDYWPRRRGIGHEEVVHGEQGAVPGREWWAPRLSQAFMRIWKQKRAEDLLHVAGVDGASICDFCQHVEDELSALATELAEGAYARGALRLAEEAKEDGEMRPVWVPNTRDRVVARAVHEWLWPRADAHLLDACVGSRMGYGVRDALRRIQEATDTGHTHFVRTDISSFFDSVPRVAAFRSLRDAVGPSLMCDLAEALTLCPLSATHGVAQGIAVSPLIANLYLAPVDRRFGDRHYVRYVDDIAVVCGSSKAAARAQQQLAAMAQRMGLRLNTKPNKTYVRKTTEEPPPRFLGFEFRGNRICVPGAVKAELQAQLTAARRLAASRRPRSAAVAERALHRARYFAVSGDPAVAQLAAELAELAADE